MKQLFYKNVLVGVMKTIAAFLAGMLAIAACTSLIWLLSPGVMSKNGITWDEKIIITALLIMISGSVYIICRLARPSK